MSSYKLRCVAVIGIAALSMSCDDSAVPFQPDVPAPAPAIELPAAPTPFPGPGTYVFTPTPGIQHAFATGSRYMLEADGRFTLQLASVDFPGTYTVDGGRISLNFAVASRAGAWTATGAFNGDSLTVKYNPIMIMSDFEDAVYVREK